MKIAEQIASNLPAAYDASLVAEERAIAVDQIWSGDGYTKYTFDDNSVLIQSGGLQYALDADNEQSIRGYAIWLGDDTHIEQAEIDRLLEAVEV